MGGPGTWGGGEHRVNSRGWGENIAVPGLRANKTEAGRMVGAALDSGLVERSWGAKLWLQSWP